MPADSDPISHLEISEGRRSCYAADAKHYKGRGARAAAHLFGKGPGPSADGRASLITRSKVVLCVLGSIFFSTNPVKSCLKIKHLTGSTGLTG